MKTFTLTLAALLLTTPALAAPKLKTLPLDKSGCAQNMQVKKGERYRIPAASDGTMFTVLMATPPTPRSTPPQAKPCSLNAPRWITARASNLPN